jgi:hypothetical protein
VEGEWRGEKALGREVLKAERVRKRKKKAAARSIKVWSLSLTCACWLYSKHLPYVFISSSNLTLS